MMSYSYAHVSPPVYILSEALPPHIDSLTEISMFVSLLFGFVRRYSSFSAGLFSTSLAFRFPCTGDSGIATAVTAAFAGVFAGVRVLRRGRVEPLSASILKSCKWYAPASGQSEQVNTGDVQNVSMIVADAASRVEVQRLRLRGDCRKHNC